ncbi:MAG: glutaminase A [Solirubrobacteraceae bacterium]|nr:glutaminase A [Solirubrobacteraceae bacterium]
MPTPEISRQLDQRLRTLRERHQPAEKGSVAQYYESGRGYYGPDVAGAECDQFGISFVAIGDERHHAGDHDRPFALQSISKVLVYGLALQDHGRAAVLERVGVEPSGEAFNSIDFDERNHRPHNPMVNAGALATTDLIRGRDSEEKLERILAMIRRCAANPDLEVDWDTFERERRGADRNRAIAYLMRSQEMIAGDVEATLALYLQQCSVRVTCDDLAVIAATLANGGVNPLTGECALQRDFARDVLSVMYTCGMYDFAGQWAHEVGVPAKSGVSGGLLAVIPGKLGIGIFSPGLDEFGSSVRGVQVCKELSDRYGLHIFATEDEDALLGARALDD